MDNLTVVKTFYQSLEAGQLEKAIGMLHDDVEWVGMEGFPYGGVSRGPDAVVKNVFAKFGAEWATWQAAIDEFMDAGDDIVVLGSYKGTYKATEKSMTAAFAHVYHVQDGRIVRFRQFTDTLKVREAM